MPLKGGVAMEYLIMLVVILVLIERILSDKEK